MNRIDRLTAILLLLQFTQALSLDIPSRPYPTPFLDYLLRCAREEQWLAITYRSEKGLSQQTLFPIHVRTEAGLWYCEAYSYERKATRVYRVDRFLDVKVAPSPPPMERPTFPIVHVHSSFPEIQIHLTARGVLRLEREPHLTPHIQQLSEGEGLLKLASIEAHGGKTVIPKAKIPHVGWWAVFTDPAGNHIGLSIRGTTGS